MDGSIFGKLIEGVGCLFDYLALILIISVPLAIWKIVDIIIWLLKQQ